MIGAIEKLLEEEASYEYLGDFSATPPWHSRSMNCNACKVRWTGCWDNFQCPKCGKGELPTNGLEENHGKE